MILLLMACQEPINNTGKIIEIPTEAYEWACHDKQEHSIVNVTAGVCNDFESLVVSVSLINDGFIHEEMYHDGGCWWSASILQEEYCIEIENVSITADKQ